MTTASHKLVLPSDANHHGTLYAGAMLRFVLEAGYATAWKHIGTDANLITAPAWPAHPAFLARFLEALGTSIHL